MPVATEIPCTFVVNDVDSQDVPTGMGVFVADIDTAQDHVHLLFYIWLADNNGCKIVDALKRAAGAYANGGQAVGSCE